MPWNVWISEASVQVAFVSLCYAVLWTRRSHQWCERCRYSDDPVEWGFLPKWERLYRWNLTWMLFTVVMLAFQIRMHLYHVGVMPMPNK